MGAVQELLRGRHRQQGVSGARCLRGDAVAPERRSELKAKSAPQRIADFFVKRPVRQEAGSAYAA
jgi:hypothetical protein